MEAPYRESASADGRRYRPMRILLRELHFRGSPKVAWAAVPFILIAVWQLWTRFSTTEIARQDSSFSVLMTLGLMAVSILYIVHRAYGGQKDVVRVFEDAIVQEREGTLTEIRWDEVATLTSAAWRDPRGQLAQRHVLEGIHGQAMTLTTELEGVESLADDLRERVLARVLPLAVRTLRAGGKVSFGELVAAKCGLASRGGVASPWTEIAGVTAEHGVVTVKQGDRVERFERVPNAHVLAALSDVARDAGYVLGERL